MEELGMITQAGQNEHEDSADGLVQLLQLIDGGVMGKATAAENPLS
jgi:hypothetical protein